MKPFDLSKASGEELLGYLSHPNEWFRKQAIHEIEWRHLTELGPKLKAMPQTLETLWALDALGLACSRQVISTAR